MSPTQSAALRRIVKHRRPMAAWVALWLAAAPMDGRADWIRVVTGACAAVGWAHSVFVRGANGWRWHACC